MARTQADGIEALGTLAEPSRRALYDYVASQADAVGREQAADAVGLPVHSAKFHLDRLVDEGLLDVEFRRLTGRAGPGAGRPSKLYRRSTREVVVTLPPRRYDLAGHVLAEAVELVDREQVPLREAVTRAAAAAGRRMAPTGPRPRGRAAEVARVTQVLADHGYEPRPSGSGDELELANCPFDTLAREHTDLICGMNLALVGGAIEALGCRTIEARLEPSPDLCCVRAVGRGQPG